uniref:Cleft lip and palate transmembrane protein 1 n=1 Tax=Aureoumbra lagunensis TaxID=44058 RepID=A0A7S3NLU1_9STRA
MKKKSSRGGLTSWLNSSTLATLFAIGYIVLTGKNFAKLLDPLADLPDEVWQRSGRVLPLWPENCQVSVEVAISTQAKLSADLMRNETEYSKTTVIVWRAHGFALNTNTSKSETVRLELYPQGSTIVSQKKIRHESSSWLASLFLGNEEKEPIRVALPEAAWSKLEANHTLYLHAAIFQTLASGTWKGLSDTDERRTARLEPLVLVKYEPPPTGPSALPKRKLLTDFGLGYFGPPAPWSPSPPPPGTFVAKWKPEAAVRIVAESRKWPDVIQAPGMRLIQKRMPGGGRQLFYAPPTYVDEIGLTSDKYISLNNSLNSLPLTISFSPLSFARWQLIAKMEDGLRAQQRDFGLSDNDIDDVRRLIADTHTWLLAVTILASCLHLLFEFLAFKSDVEFWRNNKSLQGLSARSVIVELVSQTVVLAFLIDEGSSLLVSIPSALGILVQCWKVRRATGITIDTSKPFFISCPRLVSTTTGTPKLDNNLESDEDRRARELLQTTQRVDAAATFYLSLVLLPLIVGWSLKCLVYDAHRGWYSWALGSATASVYTFGFILMVPQLALNYTLKSVSHLPWKLLCFRFVNTFIDDLFAFVIKMPTMHRVSCFRDDIVFLIYLYQRWIYPVDIKRGTAAEDAAH